MLQHDRLQMMLEDLLSLGQCWQVDQDVTVEPARTQQCLRVIRGGSEGGHRLVKGGHDRCRAGPGDIRDNQGRASSEEPLS